MYLPTKQKQPQQQTGTADKHQTPELSAASRCRESGGVKRVEGRRTPKREQEPQREREPQHRGYRVLQEPRHQGHRHQVSRHAGDITRQFGRFYAIAHGPLFGELFVVKARLAVLEAVDLRRGSVARAKTTLVSYQRRRKVPGEGAVPV